MKKKCRQARWQDKMRRAGRCTQCGKKRPKNYKWCRICLKKRHERYLLLTGQIQSDKSQNTAGVTANAG